MTEFNFYKTTEVYREKYFQLPKVFFTSDKYKGMSNDVKMAYAILKDRFDYSIQNNWVDDSNNIYFIFTQSELMDMLNCKSEKLSKIKKTLEKVGLLYQKRGGFRLVDGQPKNLPNLLYLGKPEVTSQDVFKINKDEFHAPKQPSDADSTGYSKIEHPQKEESTGIASGYSKIEHPQEVAPTKGSTGYSKIEHYLLDSSKAFDTHDTNNTQQAQEQLLLDIFVEQADNTATQGLSKACLQTIATFTQDILVAEETVGNIIKAKAVVQKEDTVDLYFEDFQAEIYQTVRNVFFNLQKKLKVGTKVNTQAFIYKSMYNFFKKQSFGILSERAAQPLPSDIPDLTKG